MRRHELTDNQWKKIKPFIHQHGRKSKLGDRNFVNAVLYVLRTGIPWRDLPEWFGSWKTIYNRFAKWNHCARAPGCSGWKRGLEFNCLGRSRGGFSTKIHAIVDTKGRPLHLELTPGQRHEAIVAESLLEHANWFGLDSADKSTYAILGE